MGRRRKKAGMALTIISGRIGYKEITSYLYSDKRYNHYVYNGRRSSGAFQKEDFDDVFSIENLTL
jgi:hypothetical protein